MQPAETVTIYKAPQKGKGQKLLKEGFQPVDFPYNPPSKKGRERIEVIVPQELFLILNKFPRVLKPQ